MLHTLEFWVIIISILGVALIMSLILTSLDKNSDRKWRKGQKEYEKQEKEMMEKRKINDLQHEVSSLKYRIRRLETPALYEVGQTVWVGEDKGEITEVLPSDASDCWGYAIYIKSKKKVVKLNKNGFTTTKPKT